MKMMPNSMKRKAVESIAHLLKELLRTSHKDQNLLEGEEDFGLLVVQADKTNPESPLYAIVTAVDAKGEVKRNLHSYQVDKLVDTLKNHI